MSTRRVNQALHVIAVGLALDLTVATASAQQVIIKGEFGLMGGVTAPPGVYVGAFANYGTASTLKGPGGESINTQGSLSQWVFGPFVSYVSKFKLLGANYSALVAPPFASLQVDYPRIGVDQSTGVALSQFWIIPFSLGWHLTQADVTFHYAIYPATGRYTPGAANNTSLGMWVNELSLRGTWFIDKGRNWHASLSAFYDINSKKQGTDWTTGNPLTLMYGAGRNFGNPKKLSFGWAGIVGYAQWQVTSTTGTDVPAFVAASKSQIYGLGPEFTTLQGALTLRYFWQFDGRFSTQGQNLYLQFAMPI